MEDRDQIIWRAAESLPMEELIGALGAGRHHGKPGASGRGCCGPIPARPWKL